MYRSRLMKDGQKTRREQHEQQSEQQHHHLEWFGGYTDNHNLVGGSRAGPQHRRTPARRVRYLRWVHNSHRELGVCSSGQGSQLAYLHRLDQVGGGVVCQPR